MRVIPKHGISAKSLISEMGPIGYKMPDFGSSIPDR